MYHAITVSFVPSLYVGKGGENIPGNSSLTKSTFPANTPLIQPPVLMGTSVFRTAPKLASGRMALTRKLGFSFSTKSHSAFSASALLALYTAVGPFSGKGGEVTDQASAMAASFQLLVLMLEGELSGVGLATATELEVKTTDLTEGARVAERRRVVTPRMVWGMTALGSALKVMTEALWMMPWTSGEVSSAPCCQMGGVPYP